MPDPFCYTGRMVVNRYIGSFDHGTFCNCFQSTIILDQTPEKATNALGTRLLVLTEGRSSAPLGGITSVNFLEGNGVSRKMSGFNSRRERLYPALLTLG